MRRIAVRLGSGGIICTALVGGGGRGMGRILVIDDDQLVRFTIRAALEQAGHTVVEAENGERGLAAFAAEPFDLVITDLLMPEKEGVETVREIRRHSRCVPILVVSGGGAMKMLDYLAMAEAFGADRSLAKPFAPRALLHIVDELLAAPRPGGAAP